MCGFCGILNLDGTPVPPDVLDAMNAMLIHRGPDQGAAVIEGACGLANRRLAILDLSPSGALPMRSADGAITLAYNGEVYNYPDLRRTLENDGHNFRSGSDTEAVIELYRRHGADCLDSMRGMFALALWDAPHHTLLLARDRMGQKPLYYYQDTRRLIFASEIKALLCHPDVPRHPAHNLTPLLLAYGYIPAPLTFFEGIRMLPPGHALICRDGAISTHAYWTPPPAVGADSNARDMNYLDDLTATLEEAVRLRLLSDVPLGAFLSGGLDSSLIVAYMARHTSGPVKTFAIGFAGEESFDETAHARRVADLLSTDHHEFIVEPDTIDLLPFLVWHHDQPFADSSAIPTYLVSKLTREHVTVALTGDGGDELFAGYERFHAANLAAQYRRIPGPVRGGIAAVVNRLPETTSYKGIARRARRFVEGAALSPTEAYFSWVRLFSDEQIATLYDGVIDPAPTPHFTGLFKPNDPRDLTAQLLDVNQTTYLPDDLLIKADRSSMAPSLEARAPFLDHKLVELAARIPSNLKLRGGVTKHILKQAAAGLLPDDIIYRPKHGFGVPLGRWFREGLRDYAHNVLLDSGTLARGYFHEAAIRHLLDEHTNGQRDHGQRIWTLLTFEWWHRLFIDPSTPTPL
ncbi:MAG: asparagine synthase (glutamine-hydrolyzing) [Anaerolineae bacterium]|nr:asparagine synthase (glutamine-hydrolyzing) [Anaerolineae bacterium]